MDRQQLLRHTLNLSKLLDRGAPIQTSIADARHHLALGASNANHEELIEVRREDRRELRPCKQRGVLFLRLFQYTTIELQPA